MFQRNFLAGVFASNTFGVATAASLIGTAVADFVKANFFSLIKKKASTAVTIRIQPNIRKVLVKPSFATRIAPAAGESTDASVWTSPLPAINFPC